MRLGPLGSDDVAPVVAAVAAWQRDPARHVAYVGLDPTTIAEELAEAASWRERTVVARDDGRTVIGVVLADVDDERGHVWWIGPWATGDDVLAAVLETAVGLLPPGVTRQEFAPDGRNRAVADLAARFGAVRNTASSVLVLDPLVPPPGRPVDGVTIAPATPQDAEVLAALHDALFPDTHTTGVSLARGDGDDVLVASEAGTVVGYVATQVQPDGSLYVDYLGTAPAARRRGIASLLIGDALRRAAADGLPRSHLTVRHDATGARALYLSLGYEEERVIVPWRIGFDLG